MGLEGTNHTYNVWLTLGFMAHSPGVTLTASRGYRGYSSVDYSRGYSTIVVWGWNQSTDDIMGQGQGPLDPH